MYFKIYLEKAVKVVSFFFRYLRLLLIQGLKILFSRQADLIRQHTVDGSEGTARVCLLVGCDNLFLYSFKRD